MMTISPLWRAAGLTTLAMIAFAANSVLTRMALAPDLIDWGGFASIRIASGAATLWLILVLRARPPAPGAFRPAMVAALAVYMIGFSLAYVALDTGIGALILFGTVQIGMIGTALFAGERPAPLGWLGLALAAAGVVWLLAPGTASAPDPLGAALMVAAGLGWAVYSLLGRGVADPLAASAWNFLAATPPVLIAAFLFGAPLEGGSVEGVALAVASGAVASGLGYVIWYAALPLLSASTAATVQLSVPVIAAVGGVLLLAEPVTGRLVLAGLLTLGGIALFLRVRR